MEYSNGCLFLFRLMYNWQESDALTEDQVKKSNKVQRKLEQRQKDRRLDTLIEAQFAGGRLLACISSQPGLCGRAMGNCIVILLLICFY